MQSEGNSNVYQTLVHKMNWKGPLRVFFFGFFFEKGGGSGGGGLCIIQDHDFLGGIMELCIFIYVSFVFINDTCIQHQ